MKTRQKLAAFGLAVACLMAQGPAWASGLKPYHWVPVEADQQVEMDVDTANIIHYGPSTHFIVKQTYAVPQTIEGHANVYKQALNVGVICDDGFGYAVTGYALASQDGTVFFSKDLSDEEKVYHPAITVLPNDPLMPAFKAICGRK